MPIPNDTTMDIPTAYERLVMGKLSGRTFDTKIWKKVATITVIDAINGLNEPTPPQIYDLKNYKIKVFNIPESIPNYIRFVDAITSYQKGYNHNINFIKEIIDKLKNNTSPFNPYKRKYSQTVQIPTRQEAAQQEAARQETARQETARQETARQEAARQETARQEAARQAIMEVGVDDIITDNHKRKSADTEEDTAKDTKKTRVEDTEETRVEETEKDKCSICFEELNDTTVTINCGNKHKFHKACITEYVSYLRPKPLICPLCRNNFNKYELTPIYGGKRLKTKRKSSKAKKGKRKSSKTKKDKRKSKRNNKKRIYN
jgi:hypothetical protein